MIDSPEAAGNGLAAMTAEPPGSRTPSATSPVPIQGTVRPGPPRDERWLRMPDPYGSEYKWRFRAWINYPRRLANDLTSGDDDRVLDALKQIILEHNNWADADGHEYPSCAEDFEGFWDSIEQPVALAMQVMIGAEVSKLSASAMPKQRR